MANQNNPGDALGTPNKYGGMTSVEGYSAGAANAFSAGIVSGFRVRADNPLGMSVRVGGETASGEAIKDVALLTDDGIGDRHVVFNRNNTPIKLTIPPAPTANSRLDAIVLYKDMTVEGDSDTTDNPGSVGIVVVGGDVAATPQLPNAAKIRSALPNGTTTLYQVIASVQVTSGASLITDANINDIRQRSYLTRELIRQDKIYEKTNIAGPFGLKLNIQRRGNMCIAMAFSTTSSMPVTVTGNERIPIGYRPTIPTRGTMGIYTADTGQSSMGTFLMRPDGLMSWNTEHPSHAGWPVTVFVVYFTDDPEPSN